ncbi:MAG TPA: hypothetical protein VK498_08920 [Ferruginibacter sp.]|nr:hypothetical protein [Ferruginibacter sp.]
MNSVSKDIFQLIFKTPVENFESAALQVFEFQYKNNPLYQQFCTAIRIEPAKIKTPEQIPFLPIGFFKTKKVVSTPFKPETIFKSSGTTGKVCSTHYIKSVELYRESFINCFTHFYGPVTNWCIIGLLPSYLEQGNSSLVYMVDELIRKSGDTNSGFYLHDMVKLEKTLAANEARKKPTFLIGVTYALLDFARQHPMTLQNTTVVETGGMKGRHKELTREEVHDVLKKQLGLNEIHSEYGMTELLSQAWSQEKGLFQTPPWMKVMLRSEDDPFNITGKDPVNEIRGAINIIDLANYYSCSFIATDDNGKLQPDGRFSVLGRLDNSDTRGCGLMWI